MSNSDPNGEIPVPSPQVDQQVISVAFRQPQWCSPQSQLVSTSPTSSRTLLVRLLCLYPQGWRERYGEELAELLAQERTSLLTLVSLLAGACDAHLHQELVPLYRRPLVREQLRLVTLQVFGACIAFFVAAAFLYEAAHDVSVGPFPSYSFLMRLHPDLLASWTLFIAGAALTILAVLVGGLPILLAAIREAKMRRPGDLRLLLIPPGAALLLGGCDACEEGLRRAHIALPTPLGLALDLMFHLLFLLAAAACVAAISLFVGRSNITVRLLRYALVPATLATLGMGLTFGATVNWLAVLHAETPRFFGVNALTIGGIVLVGGFMVSSMLFAGKAVVGGFKLGVGGNL